jgi:plasmid stability protein
LSKHDQSVSPLSGSCQRCTAAMSSDREFGIMPLAGWPVLPLCQVKEFVMPTLIVDNLPLDIYQQLERRASARQRSVEDETVELLQQALRTQETDVGHRLPDLVPQDEGTAPCDLPRPAPATRVGFCTGSPRLPDPPC